MAGNDDEKTDYDRFQLLGDNVVAFTMSVYQSNNLKQTGQNTCEQDTNMPGVFINKLCFTVVYKYDRFGDKQAGEHIEYK